MNPLEIPLKETSDKRVTFTESSVSFGDVSIAYSDVASIRFGSGKTTTSVTDTTGFMVLIRSVDGAKIDIRTRTIRFSLFGSEPKHNFEKIVAAIFEFIAPELLARTISTIFTPGQHVKIASMIFDSNGITSESFLGSRKRSPWSERPEVRSVTGNNYLTGASYTGIFEVSYFNPLTSKMIVIGKTSSTDENGFLVPHICRIINEACKSSQDGPKR
jgi:hypothetical protein